MSYRTNRKTGGVFRVPQKLPPTYKLGMPGVASFLEPPGHPFHETRPVYTQFGNSPREGEYYYNGRRYDSLEQIEKQWVPIPYTDPVITAWEAEVYNYFRNSYSPDGVNRNVSDSIIVEPRENAFTNSSPDKFTTIPQPPEHSLAYLYVKSKYPEAVLREEWVTKGVPGAKWSREQADSGYEVIKDPAPEGYKEYGEGYEVR